MTAPFHFQDFCYNDNMNCIFCDIIRTPTRGFIIWQNRDFVLLLDIKPINTGHLLLVPKKHIRDISDMSETLHRKTFELARKASKILKDITGAKRIGLAIEGFGVPHAHVHLVPVNRGNELNPLRAKRISEEILRNM